MKTLQLSDLNIIRPGTLRVAWKSTTIITDEEMKYDQVINLVEGTRITVPTTLTADQIPYSYLIEDSDGTPVGGYENIESRSLVNGVWVLEIYSSATYTNANLKIIY